MERKDNFYKLEEMAESMQESINNARKVKEQQEELLNIIETSGSKHKFEEFIKGIEEQEDNIEKQIANLSGRLIVLRNLLKDADDNVKSSINNLLFVLNVFGE